MIVFNPKDSVNILSKIVEVSDVLLPSRNLTTIWVETCKENRWLLFSGLNSPAVCFLRKRWPTLCADRITLPQISFPPSYFCILNILHQKVHWFAFFVFSQIIWKLSASVLAPNAESLSRPPSQLQGDRAGKGLGRNPTIKISRATRVSEQWNASLDREITNANELRHLDEFLGNQVH